MMTWNKAENTITDYRGNPRPILSVGSANSGSCLDFAVGPVDQFGRANCITTYPDNLRIIE